MSKDMKLFGAGLIGLGLGHFIPGFSGALAGLNTFLWIGLLIVGIILVIKN